jgi:hypothetical protein
MDDEDPFSNGGATIVVIFFHYKTSPHMWPSIIHDSIKENHMQNRNKN